MSDIDNTRNPFAAPGAQVQDAQSSSDKLAGRGARFLAALLDGVIGACISGVLALVLAVNPFNPEDQFSTGYFLVLGVGMIVNIVLQGFFLATRSQTLGKMALGIRITRTDGSRASGVRLILGRWLPVTFIGVIPGIGALIVLVDALMIFRESRRCLHDVVADTIVVRA